MKPSMYHGEHAWAKNLLLDEREQIERTWALPRTVVENL